VQRTDFRQTFIISISIVFTSNVCRLCVVICMFCSIFSFGIIMMIVSTKLENGTILVHVCLFVCVYLCLLS